MDDSQDKDLIQSFALARAAAQAQSLGIKGMAAVLIIVGNAPLILQPKLALVGRLYRSPDSASRGLEDVGTNDMAVVFAKIAEMVRTHQNSGSQEDTPPLKGELGYQGGVYEYHLAKKAHLFAAFSGGTPKQDVQIALAAMKVLKRW